MDMSGGALALTGRRPVTVLLGAPVVAVLTDLPLTVHALVVHAAPPAHVGWVRRPSGGRRSFPLEEADDSLDVLRRLGCVVVDAASAAEDAVLIDVKAVVAAAQGTGAGELTSPAPQVWESCLKVVGPVG